MTDYGIYTLKIDDEFKNLIPPLSPEERRQLEENIVQDGCRDPISVWNKSILDGHNRYEICTRLQIPFRIAYVFMRSREEAVAWICANQLGRRNITDEARRYLIGKRYEMSKIIGAHNAAGTNQHTRKEVRAQMLPEPPFEATDCRTRERLGKEYNISHLTIMRYGTYAKAIDKLAATDPELISKILSGKVKITQDNVKMLSRLSPPEIHRVKSILTEGNIGYSDTRNIVPQKKNSPKSQLPTTPSGSIKNMPDYDPDAEISSLTFTIPSWISSISRVRSSANINEISNDARRKLEERLVELESAIGEMIATLGEES